MKIKKHGKLFDKEPPVHTEKFKCDGCGCEFTCLDDEYYVDFYGADSSAYNQILGTTTTYTYTRTVRDYLVCSCPECHKIVKKVRERERTDWSNPVTYTYLDTTTPSIDKDKITITCDATTLKEVCE